MEMDRIVDWLDLEKDIFELILTRLTALSDLIRFGAVCKTWRSIFLENRQRLPQQLPVLIIPNEDDESNEFRSFFDLSAKNTYRLKKLPNENRGKWCCGSSEGELIMADLRLNISLFNPFSRTEKPLPSLTTLSDIIDVHENDTGTIKYTCQLPGHRRLVCISKYMNEMFVHKAITSGPYVVAIFALRLGLAFCRRDGDDSWTHVKSDWSHFEDIMCFKGNLYVVTLFGCVGILDLSGPRPTVMPIDMIIERDLVFRSKYLVESSGELLVVAKRLDLQRTTSFDIFRVDVNKHQFSPSKALGDVMLVLGENSSMDMNKHQLFPLKALGDVMLFLGENCSMSLSARDFAGCKGNRIYFTEVDKDGYFEGQLQGHNLVVYNVEDGSIEAEYKMDSKWLRSRPTWLVPKP